MRARLYCILAVTCAGLFGCAPAGTTEPIAPPKQGDATSAVTTPQTFRTAGGMDGWSFSDGPEWPGAKGALEWRPDGGRNGGGVAALSFDFENGGHYVAAFARLPQDRPVRAVRLWVHKPVPNLMIFRAVDREGETFQKDLRYDYPGWQQLEVSLDEWQFSWSGDGNFDGSPQEFHILVENEGGQRSGTVLLDDVQWVYETASDPSVGYATATYAESEFDRADAWHYDGPPLGGRDGGLWEYAFTDDAPYCRLVRDRGILGRPQTMRLTLISDGAGHELRATLGSHFQMFERSLGTLARKGLVTLEVPMGDMKTWRHFAGEDDGIVRYPLRLLALSLHRTAPGDAGRLVLRRLEFVTRYDPPGETISIVPAIATSDTPGRYAFQAEVRSLADLPLHGTLQFALHNMNGVVAETEVPLEIPAGGRRVIWQHPIQSDATMIEGRVRFYGKSVVSPTASATIATLPEPIGDCTLDPDSRMGVGMYLYRFHKHPQAGPWMERMCDIAARAGVKWTREEFHWNWIEPKRDEYDFAFFDQLVETATKHGISVYALCCYWTNWTKPCTDEGIEDYCRYLETLVRRYGGRIKHWEIWNEPNVFFWSCPREMYAELLTRAYETIKRVDPDAQVLGCSTAGIDTGFIKLVMDHGGPFDALTVHPYRGVLDPYAFIRELRETREIAGGRDVWITEMGWPSHVGGLSERAQANHVARTYASALASGAARSVAWYDFREDGTDPYYNEHHFGLIRNDLTPKIGYRTLAAVGRLIGTAAHEADLDPEPAASRTAGSEGVVAFRFREGDRRTVVLWAPDRARMATLDTKGVEVRIVNAIGEPARAARDRGRYAVVLERNMPIYVIADEPFELQCREFPVAINPDRTKVHPGERVEWDEPVLDAMTQTPHVRSIPPGWRLADSAVQSLLSDLVVPDDAAPGRYTVTFTVQTLGGPEFLLPVELEVVPRLIRG